MDYDLGFLGGGQLARMSIQSAQRMGLRCLSLDPGEDTPASQIADSVKGSLSDVDAIAKVVRLSRFVTLENEFIPARAIRDAVRQAGREENCVVPGIDTLGVIQDKLTQRQALFNANVPSPLAVAIDDDGDKAIEQIGFPMVLKARFGGYDGKGTRYARTKEEFDSFRDLWANGGWMAESFVPFRRELAVMVVRTQTECVAFPTMETIQTDHVCDLVFPCTADGTQVAMSAIEAVGGVGLFGVELFECEDGSILVNEIAPRPHNSGHYTLDWGGPSQFEAHVRVAMGLPQEKPISASIAVMANLLGQVGAKDYRNGIPDALAIRGAHFHWYGKVEAKHGRKMGHINVSASQTDDVSEVVERANESRNAFYAAWTA